VILQQERRAAKKEVQVSTKKKMIKKEQLGRTVKPFWFRKWLEGTGRGRGGNNRPDKGEVLKNSSKRGKGGTASVNGDFLPGGGGE